MHPTCVFHMSNYRQIPPKSYSPLPVFNYLFITSLFPACQTQAHQPSFTATTMPEMVSLIKNNNAYYNINPWICLEAFGLMCDVPLSSRTNIFKHSGRNMSRDKSYIDEILMVQIRTVFQENESRGLTAMKDGSAGDL